MRQNLSLQLLHGDSIANPTKRNKGQTDTFTGTEQRCCAEIPKHSPAGGSSCCTTIAIILCGPAPLIVLFFLLVLLLILALSFLGNDHCIHTTDSTPPNNNNSDSVVDKRPSRSNNIKPIDTPGKHDRNVHTSSRNCPTPFRSPADPKTTLTL